MSLLELGPVQVARVIQSVRRDLPRARRIGIHHEGAWKGGETVRDGQEEFRVALCPSPLAVRAALVEAGEEPLVVLTPANQEDLGLDVLARFAKGRLLSVERWEGLKHVFGATRFDPRLSKLKWLADELLAAAPADGYELPENGYLDLDRAWQTFFEHRLGIRSARPDLRELLAACLHDKPILGLKSWPEEVRRGVAERIADGAGDAGRLFVAALDSDKPLHPVAIGLVARVLFDTASGRDEAELKQAAVRLEPSLSGQSLKRPVAQEWAREAELLASSAKPSVLQKADQLLSELKVQQHAWRSRFLPSGFDQRVARLARSVVDALDGSPRPEALVETARQVGEHVSAKGSGERRRRAAEMAARLTRWATSAPRRVRFASFHEGVTRYRDELSFVDRALEELAVVEPNSEAAKAYGRLASEVLSRRAEISREFAERLAAWSENPGAGGGLVPVERALVDVVAPLAKQRSILLLVLDGMSYSVFRQVFEELDNLGWVEMARDDVAGRLSAVAALPSITEVSRASLLSGSLRTGNSADEKKAFEGHEALKTASKGGKSPILFHKAELGIVGGYGLPDEIGMALSASGPRVVGLVINAVDDHLLKGGQVSARWGVDVIKPLHPVLEAALAAGRLLVVTADHGHVLERGTQQHSFPGAGERHRPATTPPEEGEVLVRGPRVVFPGGAVVLPWSQEIRYAGKKNGYHGGASPEEVVVPLAVFAPGEVDLEGFSELASDAPDWWELEAASPASVPAKTPKKAAQPSLFAPPATSLVDRLLASERWKEQLGMAGRVRPEEGDVRKVIDALIASQGALTTVALAKRLATTTARTESKLAALRKTLNVEGYAVLHYDESSQTIRLNQGLLVEQFSLET